MRTNFASYRDELLPPGFIFPRSFTNLMNADIIPYYEPWWFLHKFPEEAREWLEEVVEEYPDRPLVPFAKFGVFDDVACFDGTDTSGDPRIIYINQTMSSGWSDEDQGDHSHFERWIEVAKADSAKWKAERQPRR